MRIERSILSVPPAFGNDPEKKGGLRDCPQPPFFYNHYFEYQESLINECDKAELIRQLERIWFTWKHGNNLHICSV